MKQPLLLECVMNSIKFDINRLHRELECLPKSYRVAFAASCCERLLPNYLALSRSTYRAGYSTLRKALDRVWASLAGEHLPLLMIQQLKQTCEQTIPDASGFTDYQIAAALDASRAVLETVQCMADGSPRRAAEVASIAKDTVYLYIRCRDDLAYSAEAMERIQVDPLFVRELQTQRCVLDALSSARQPDAVLFHQLRSLGEQVLEA